MSLCNHNAHPVMSYCLIRSPSLPTSLSAIANIIFLPFFQIAFKTPREGAFTSFFAGLFHIPVYLTIRNGFLTSFLFI